MLGPKSFKDYFEVGNIWVIIVSVVAVCESAGVAFEVVWAKFGGSIKYSNLTIHQPVSIEALSKNISTIIAIAALTWL